MITIHNVTTGEITSREMNNAESKQLELDAQAETMQQKINETKAATKASALAKLAALGLTADEIAAL